MKKNTYIQDIEDTLGEQSSSKNVLSITKKIKSSQKKAFPSIEFKQHLSDKLSNIYILNVEEEEKPRFTILQLFGAFASFIFIAGGIFSFHHMREMSQIQLPESYDTLSVPSQSYEMKMLEMPDSDDSQGFENDDIQSEENQIEGRNMNNQQEINIAPRIIEKQDTLNVNDTFQEDYSSSVGNMRNMQQNKSDESEEGFFQDDINQPVMAESFIFMSEPASDEMMQDIPSLDFAGLCEGYEGVYDYQTQICTLQFGLQCQEYNENTIIDCYNRDISNPR